MQFSVQIVLQNVQKSEINWFFCAKTIFFVLKLRWIKITTFQEHFDFAHCDNRQIFINVDKNLLEI